MVDGNYRDDDSTPFYEEWAYENEPSLEKRIENLEALAEELAEELETLRGEK